MAMDIKVREGERTVDLGIALRAMRDLAEALKEQKIVNRRVEDLKDWVKRAFGLSGATVGQIAGVNVASNRASATFQRAAFAKNEPELARHYTRQVVTEELDVALLRVEHPDLADKYTSRVLLVDDAALVVAAEKLAANGGGS